MYLSGTIHVRALYKCYLLELQQERTLCKKMPRRKERFKRKSSVDTQAFTGYDSSKKDLMSYTIMTLCKEDLSQGRDKAVCIAEHTLPSEKAKRQALEDEQSKKEVPSYKKLVVQPGVSLDTQNFMNSERPAAMTVAPTSVLNQVILDKSGSEPDRALSSRQTSTQEVQEDPTQSKKKKQLSRTDTPLETSQNIVVNNVTTRTQKKRRNRKKRNELQNPSLQIVKSNSLPAERWTLLKTKMLRDPDVLPLGFTLTRHITRKWNQHQAQQQEKALKLRQCSPQLGPPPSIRTIILDTPAHTLLDTGCSTYIMSKKFATQLGIPLQQVEDLEVELALEGTKAPITEKTGMIQV
jgi:hypothetical protein